MLEKLFAWATAQNLKNLPVITSGKRGPGWTCAQVQRMATKKRNQVRNRKAHR